jgi:hypothetical protein
MRPLRVTTAALLTAAIFFAARATRGQAGDAGGGSIWITTDPNRVAGCAALGSASLESANGLDALRREASRRGADVLRLRSLTDRDIAGDFYRCATAPAPRGNPTATPVAPSAPSTSPAVTPAPVVTALAAAPARSPSPSATPSPTAGSAPPTPSPTAGRRSSRATPAPPTSAERQRLAREELEGLAATVRVVADAALVEGCEKLGERQGTDVTEAVLREEAVGSLANVVLLKRNADGTLSGELFRCSRPAYQRIPTPAPTPAR